MAMNMQSFMNATIASEAIQSPLIPTEQPTELLQPILHIVLELMNLFRTICRHSCLLLSEMKIQIHTIQKIIDPTVTLNWLSPPTAFKQKPFLFTNWHFRL